MKPHKRFAIALALTASMVFLPAVAEPPVGGPERVVWAAMPVPETPYAPPNKVHTRIADILAAHRGQASWTVPVVRTPAFAGDYVSLAPGEATKAMFYSEERVVLWVYSGQMRVEIEGQSTTKVTKGFLVDVAPTLIYRLINTGGEPAVFFRLTPFGQLPSFPSSELPTPVTGHEYVKVRMRPYGSYEPPNQPFLDFNKDVVAVNGPSRDFAMDGHTSAHIIRGEATQPPPENDWGHFHANLPEVWLVIEGKIDLKVSGEPLVTGELGDVIMAANNRWHRASFAGDGTSTRLALMPRYKEGLAVMTQVPGTQHSAPPKVGAEAAIENSYRTRLTTAAFQPPEKLLKGDGNVVATLEGRRLKVLGDFNGLASPVTRIRILTGSAVGVPDGIQVADLQVATDTTSGSIDADLRLSSAQVELLKSSRLYLQVETQAVPDGALWGWLMPNHPFPGEHVPEKRNWYAQ
jgi:quercetin dioxygenase-like cupin family protein